MLAILVSELVVGIQLLKQSHREFSRKGGAMFD